jgi:predicted RNA methylase
VANNLFYSSDYATTALRPKLVVDYTAGGGTLSITVSDTAGSSESVVVSIPVSQLNIGWLNIHNG